MRWFPLAAAAWLSVASPELTSQTISRVSAPAIGKTFTLEYTSTSGAVYVMFAAAPPPVSITVPGILGTLNVNPATLLYLYTGVVPASLTHGVGIPLPNDPSLVNACVDFQALEVLPAYAFSNYVEACISRGIGTITVADATIVLATTGDVEVKTVTNATAGAPVPQTLGKAAVQSIYHYGENGFTPLMSPTLLTTEIADLDIDRGDVVTRDPRDANKVHMQLPNGFDLYVLRDAANPTQFYLASLNRSTGITTELTGSRVTDLGVATPTPVSMYRPQFAFTKDGKIALAIVHDSTNTPVGNVGPPDRVFLIKTDPTQLWTNGKNVFDASPAAGPDRLHTTYNGVLRIANGFGFAEGEEPSGVTGEAALWAGPIDGSALFTRVPMPQTGTLKNFYWSYSVWRVSNDQKTQIFAIGGDGTVSTTDMDVMAITNIGAGPITVTNITKFPTATQVQLFGTAGIGSSNLKTALSPDGKTAAIVLGANTAAVPGNVAIVKTDGSQAGTVTPFTTGQYDVKVNQFFELWWLTNTKLLYTGGSSTTAVDYYLYDTTTATITNLTKTTDGTTTAPFCTGGTHTGTIAVRGSFMSENGLFYYFARGYTAVANGLSSDWKGINATTNAVFDVTGTEFSGGTAPSIRPFSTAIYTWQPRRAPSKEVFFLAAKNTGVSTTFADDEIFRFNPEAGTQAVQVTANNATGAATVVKSIGDLRLNAAGNLLAYSQAVSTAAANPEDLYTITSPGGVRTQISKTPTAGGQGIARGSVYFTTSPVDGLCWVQGTNSRTAPTVNTVAYWNALVGGTTPLRLTAAPVATVKTVMIFNACPINP